MNSRYVPCPECGRPKVPTAKRCSACAGVGRPRQGPSGARITLDLLPGQREWLRERARYHGSSMADVVRRLIIAEVPSWDAPSGKSDHVPRCFSREQVYALLGRLPTAQQHPKRRAVLPYFAALWGQGFRKGTLERLRWDDVDLAAGTLRVRASADKRQHDRVVPLALETAWALRSLPRGVGLVFGRRDYRAQLDAAGEAIGLGKVRCHDLRHSRLTDLAERTHDVASLQHIAGHRDLASTMRYVHGRVERARALLDSASEEG